MGIGLPEPQLPADLFRDVDTDDSAATAEQMGVYTSKWLLRRASAYAKRLPVVASVKTQNSAGCRGGSCGAGDCSGGVESLSASTSPPPDFRGKTVLVLGAGDTAMDCATAALRCGARRVRVVFRRGTPDVRAVPEELEGAMRERCELVPHSQPVRFLFRKATGGGADRVRAVQFRRTDVDDLEPPSSPDEDHSSDDLFVLRADCVVSAFGSRLPPEGMRTFLLTDILYGNKTFFKTFDFILRNTKVNVVMLCSDGVGNVKIFYVDQINKQVTVFMLLICSFIHC